MKHTKIAIIGAGAVGSTTAYALMLRNIAAEILLIDINDLRCKGEVLDLSDTLAFSASSDIHIGNCEQARNADIIIFCAGLPQKPNQPRTELLATNKKIVESVLSQLHPIRQDAILIMVTNPVDVLTLYAQTLSPLPRHQIFGTGTLLDSIRLRGTLSKRLGVAEESIDAYVLGEHGDSQFVAWSSARIAGAPLISWPSMTEQDRQAIEKETRQKVYEIIACKGATYYGIAACITVLCESIIFDQKRVLPLSTYHKEFDVCFGLPVVLGEKGIERTIPLQLTKEEQYALEHSAKTLKVLYGTKRAE
jgi:L-lactate dehydrogenase